MSSIRNIQSADFQSRIRINDRIAYLFIALGLVLAFAFKSFTFLPGILIAIGFIAINMSILAEAIVDELKK